MFSKFSTTEDISLFFHVYFGIAFFKAISTSQVETGPLAVHSCEPNLDTNHYVSSQIKSAFSHTKNADFEIKNKQFERKIKASVFKKQAKMEKN